MEHGAQQAQLREPVLPKLLDSNEKVRSGSAALWSRINVSSSMGPLLQRILGCVGLLRNYVLKGQLNG